MSTTTTITSIPSHPTDPDLHETKFLHRTRSLRHTRLGLALLTLAIAIPTIVCEAIAYHHYRQTASYTRVWLYLWPLNLDLRPTIAILACGCVIAFQNLVYVVVAVIPSPRPHISHLNLLALTTSTTSLIATLTTLLFTIYRPNAHHPSDFHTTETLHSWTCKWDEIRYSDGSSSNSTSSTSSSSSNSTLSATTAPAHFHRDCSVTHAAFVLVGVLLGLSILMGVVAGVG
ncbi:hypothetical protein BO71DRAFT_445728, partial [Aspergillus ellipticus CBS 707.79]